MVGGTLNKFTESTVASASSIQVETDAALVTGSTAIATIAAPRNGGFAGILILVPTDSTVGLLTTGNIAIAVTMPVGRATVLYFSKANKLWYPGAIS